MFALLLIVAVILFGFGFLNPIWWMAAAVLLFDSKRYGRDRGRSQGGRVRFRRTAGSGRTAGTVSTAVGTGRVGGARSGGSANAVGDR